MSKVCGQCEYGLLIRQDVMHRMCYGSPPTAHLRMNRDGTHGIQNVRPIVKATESACGMFKFREMSPAQMQAIEAGEKSNASHITLDANQDGTQQSGHDTAKTETGNHGDR